MAKRKKRRVNYKRLILLIVGFLLVIWLFISLLVGLVKHIFYKPEVPEVVFQLDQSNLMSSNQSYKLGIDVSSFQKDIDWKAVKKTKQVDFAIIRCGYRGAQSGDLCEDETFHINAQQALKNHIPIGVYFYSAATNEQEIKEEVDFVLSIIKDYKITYPVCFDMELFAQGGRIDDLTMEEKTNLAKLFCESMEKEGYSAMIYGNKNWIEEQIDYTQLEDYPIWYAAYIEQPDLNYPFKIWQYSNQGQIDGIPVIVDMNIYLE